ncbi:hypothetical protein BGX28_010351 [Mortierella sp. GBA30]|nr:hypothetical protein BGX28_010351 [Mortierella sp. GBA30]
MSADYIVDMRDLPGSPSNGADDLQDVEEAEESSDFRNSNLVDIEQDEDSADNSDSQDSSVSETEEDEERDDDRPNGKDLCEFCTLFLVFTTRYMSVDFKSERVEWDLLWPKDLDLSRNYEVVIGISFKNVQIADIEKVVFEINDQGETISHESLKEMFCNKTDILRWKLSTLLKYDDEFCLVSENDIRVTLNLILGPMAIPLRAETFDLHYMELHALGENDWRSDPSVRVHRPICNWILDMDRRGTKIEKYAISESGDFLATFGSTIELWDLDVTSRNAPLVNPPSTTQPSPPKPYAHTCPLSVADLKKFNLSISWDGSLVATSGAGSPLIVYAVNNPKSPGHDQPVQLEVSAHGCNTDLSTFDGRGVFHSGTRNKRRSPENEVFLAVDSDSVTIYSIQERWKRLRTILTAHSGNICSIQARHFACLNNNESISVWNLDTGRALCTIYIATSADTIEQISLSGDASVIFLPKIDSVSSTYYCSSTGVQLTTGHSGASSVIQALKGDGLLRSTDRVVQRTEDLAEIFRYKPTPVLLSKDKDLYRAFLEDVDSASLFQQTWKSSPCSEACLSSLDQLKGPIGSFADFGSGLKFSIKWNKPHMRELYVTITDITTITEPKLTRDVLVVRLGRERRPEVAFAPKDRSLIVTGQNWISVFGMPTWYSGKPTLRTVQYADTAQMDIKKQLKRIMQCPHERFYLDHPILGFRSLLTLKDDAPATSIPRYISKDRLTEYLNRHINDYVSEGGAEGDVKQDAANTREKNKISMMEWVCQLEDADYRDSQLKKLLSLTEGRWIPEPRSKFNPMEFFLNKAETEPKNMKMFYLFWDYCYHRAMSERRTYFLSPITACLPSLLDRERSHSETALKALHQMTFFPVVSRPLIMLRHALIHPLEFRLDFWRHNHRPLIECKEPILQLETSGTGRPMILASNDTFQKQIFAATFNMIWTDQSKPVALKDNSYPAGVSPSMFYWITMAPFVIGHNLKPWIDKDVTTHNFPLEAFDNPALSALILYKWITLGFYIWLTRSLIYNLVDIAAFALPLGGCINQFCMWSTDNEDNVLNPRGPNSWLFSFSILVIAFHLLFELRVNKTVCQFVTAIVRIFSKIRIFFIIFLFGQLAFTAALLHLLRGCVQEPCTEPTTSFPGNFYLAFSATFFFMGGKYDPISDVFSQPNWAFHTMMIIYLFFTVILMLNVLIALINSGYDENDTTWELVWLQNRFLYIENAENLSHTIPGLRQNYDIFPKEIYYCLSEAKVKEYKSRWSKKNDGLRSKNDDLWITKDTKADKSKREMESTEKELNEKLLMMLLRKGGRMDNLEQQLKRIEKMLTTQRVKTETETNVSTTDDSESSI